MSPTSPPLNSDFATPVGTSPFAGYLASAAAGAITVGSDVAKECATNVAAMIAVVQEVQSYIDSVQSLSGFGPHSGKRLAGKFTKAATQLGDALNGHITLLTDMANTFLYAGKLYNNSESDNASLFSSILTAGFEKMSGTSSVDGSAPSTTADAMPSWGKNDKTAVPKFTATDGYGGLAKVQDASSGKDTTPVDPENPYSQSPSFFDSVHADIDAASAGNASVMWSWMGKQLTTAVNLLHKQLQSVYDSGAWQGTGSDGAGKATVAYQGTMGSLTGNITTIASNLSYTSGWLNDTKAALTPSASATTAQEQQNYAQNVQAPNFHSIYVTGINNSSSAIPNLVSPITAPSGTGSAGTGSTAGTGDAGGSGVGLGSTANSSGSATASGSGDADSAGSSGGSGGSGSGSSGSASETASDSSAATADAASSGATSSAAGTSASDDLSTVAGSALAGVSALSQAGTATEEESPLAAAEEGEAAMAGGEALGEEGALVSAVTQASVSGQNLRLFPRAGMAEDAADPATLGRNGSGAAGEDEDDPEGDGTRKRAKDEESGEYTRADYLSSKEHLNEGIGSGYVVTKPVLTP